MACSSQRELELKYPPDLGVNEKVDEKEAVEKYGINPKDTKWVDTDKAFEEEPMQIRSRICAREFENGDRPNLYAGTPPLETLKTLSIAANHKETFSIMHRCVTCVLPREGPETSAVTTTGRGQNGHRCWESGLDEEEHARHEGRGQQLGMCLARARQKLGISTWTQLEESSSPQRKSSIGLDTRRRLRAHKADKETDGVRQDIDSVLSIKAKIISYGSPKSIKTLNRRLHWRKRRVVYQHDPRHVDVLVNDLQTPATPDATEEAESESLSQVQQHKYRSQVARCLLLIQDRRDIHR